MNNIYFSEPAVFPIIPYSKVIDIGGLYSFLYMEHGKNFYFPGERHDSWEMVYVDSGEISVIADHQGHILKQGDVIFHQPLEFHTLASDLKQPHNVLVICFDASGTGMDFFRNRVLTVDRALAMLTKQNYF